MNVHRVNELVFIEFENKRLLNLGDIILKTDSTKELIIDAIDSNLKTVKGLQIDNKLKVLQTIYAPIKTIVPANSPYIFNDNCLLSNFSCFDNEINGLYRKVDESFWNIDPINFLKYSCVDKNKLSQVGL